MKRSRTAALLLMSATPLLLTACGDDEAMREGVYTSVQACTAQTHDAATCQQAYDKARADATANGPQFGSQQECESSYGSGKCEAHTDSTGHSFFGPLMTGFFISQLMRNGSPMTGFSSAPAFQNTSGQWQRPGFQPGTTGATSSSFRGSRGMTTIGSSADTAVTVSRGGFGSRSSGRGGFGE
ncbi:DUF1190 domain-containing protein [Dyella sp.]|uniref:DUF1190 domain-containing protein n=1 Tax=Dyella sp. TaxID=1869338 RepID=UPI002ED6AD88